MRNKRLRLLPRWGAMIKMVIIPITTGLEFGKLRAFGLKNTAQIAAAVDLEWRSVDPVHIAACGRLIREIYSNPERLQSNEACHQEIRNSLLAEVAREPAVTLEKLGNARWKGIGKFTKHALVTKRRVEEGTSRLAPSCADSATQVNSGPPRMPAPS